MALKYTYLGVVAHEPDPLAEVRALARHLEMQPRFFCPLFRQGGGVDFAFLVIGVDKVLENSTRLGST